MRAPKPGSESRIEVGLAGLPDHTDLLVVGLGVTGAGVALDAASRGLDVVAVDKAADKGANALGGAAGGEQPFEVFRRRHHNRLRISDEDSGHPPTLCDGRCGLAGTRAGVG